MQKIKFITRNFNEIIPEKLSLFEDRVNSYLESGFRLFGVSSERVNNADILTVILIRDD
jgi:hypothetical protein